MKLILSGAAAVMLALGAQAETVTYMAVPNGSTMKIDGTSTMHDYTVETKVIGGKMELDSNFPLDPSKDAPKDLTVTPKVNVRIPVRQLKSGKSLMDTVMHNAMKAEEFPLIEYTLLEMKPAGKADNGMKFTTKGVITCSGQKKTNDFDVVISKVEGDKLKVSGTTKLKMTDFGIQPPAPAIALGTIKTADDVKLTFDWVTAPKK
jgi:polyisoprenoid-binding protein YceI